MTQGVVHQLELVQIEREHRQHLAGAPRARQFQVQVLFEEGAVRQTGDGVVERQELQALPGLPALAGERRS